MPSGGIRKVSDEALAAIIEMGDAGRPTALIARKLQLTRSTVHYQLVVAGIKAPIPRSFCYMRRGFEVRSFSQDEDRLIEQLRMSGKSTTAIARAVTERFGHRRAANTVGIRLKQLANVED